jgi:hypothetical protein
MHLLVSIEFLGKVATRLGEAIRIKTDLFLSGADRSVYHCINISIYIIYKYIYLFRYTDLSYCLSPISFVLIYINPALSIP